MADRAEGFADAVVEGFSRQRLPRLSRLKEPPVHQTGPTRFAENPMFAKASATVGLYYQELGRLFAALDSAGLSGDRKAKLVKELAPEMRRWADGWAVFRVPNHQELLGQSEVSLVDLLHESLVDRPHDPERTAWQPADLSQWLNLTYGSLLKVQKSMPGCLPLGPYSDASRKESSLYRLDCYSYAPQAAKGLGAAVRAELRLVYVSVQNRPLEKNLMPDELSFLFPLPEGQDADSASVKIIADLKSAINGVSGLEVVNDDRKRSPKSGFRVSGKGLEMRVDPQPELSLASRKVLYLRAVVTGRKSP